MMNALLKIGRCAFAAGLICLASFAHADAWPISVAKLKVPGAAYGGVSSSEPVRDCQPEFFDPKTSAFHPVGAAKAASAVDAAPARTALTRYEVEGADPGVTMTINGRAKPDDARIDLPGSVVLTRYIFSCETGSSEVLVFEKNSKPYAIFTHVAQLGFTPDLSTVVFYNSAKLTHHGGWTRMRAIFNIPKKRFAPLPMVRETTYLAAVGSAAILTYALPANHGKPATVAVWNLGGKLVRAFSIPLQPAASGKGTSDGLGLLPDDDNVLYQLARSGANTAELRLQNIKNPHAHRAIALAVPGGATDPVVAGVTVQLDVSGLGLKGGEVKYRVSASGKGGDWGEWKTAQ